MKKLFCALLTAILMTSPVMAAGVNVEVNSNPIELQGTIVDGRTLVPIRGVFEELGYYVDYNANTKTATLAAMNMVVTVTQGNTYFKVNNNIITPEVPPQIIDGRFMVPLRAISEALGATVDWDASTKTAKITAEIANPGLTVHPVYTPDLEK